MFAASTVISVCLGAAPLPAIDANAFSSYLSHYNALRVAKGFFWALLLVFPLNRRIEENPSLAWFLLATGILVGLAGVGVVALWERQIFGELFNGASLYSIAGRMMEFGTSYRITGMFSGMHTGGEAIDGYLVLALPVACFVAVFAHPVFHTYRSVYQSCARNLRAGVDFHPGNLWRVCGQCVDFFSARGGAISRVTD